MATTIQEYVAERGINFLMHFTRAGNLPSILARGLVRRDTLTLEGFDGFNDQHRIDGTDAVCLSIGFPNYKMFFRLRQENKEESWAVLVVQPQVLWELDCAFCCTNAASNSVTAISLADRKGLAALQAMYGDWPTKPRAELNLPNGLPTNPQAEVLVLHGVPRKYISGVVTLTEAHKEELAAANPGLQVWARAQFFRYRNDHSHWKPGA